MKPTSFGAWLKTSRRAKGLTQKQIQEKTGIGVSHLSKIENGDIGMPVESTRARLHAALGTSDDDLVAVGLLERGESVSGETVYVEPSTRTQEDEHVGLWLRGVRQGHWSLEQVAANSGLDVEYLARLEAGLEPLPGYPKREQIHSAYWITDDDFRPYYIQDEPTDNELFVLRVHPIVAARYSEVTEAPLPNGGVFIDHVRAVGMLNKEDTPAVAALRPILESADLNDKEIRLLVGHVRNAVDMLKGNF